MHGLLLLSLLAPLAAGRAAESKERKALARHRQAGDQVFLLFCRYPRLFPGCMNAKLVLEDVNARDPAPHDSHCPFPPDPLRLVTVPRHSPKLPILAPFGLKPSHFPALVLVADDFAREYNGSLDSFEELYGWARGWRNTTSLEITPDALDDVIHSNRSSLLLVFNAKPTCSDECAHLLRWKSLTRILGPEHSLDFFHLNLSSAGAEEDWRLSMEVRLSALDMEEACAWVVHFAGGRYRLGRPETSVVGLGRWVEGGGGSWWEPQAALSPLGAFYWREERRLAGMREERAGKVVGLSGGLAVIVLAFSIFWGLSSSSSMLYADQRLVTIPTTPQHRNSI